MVEGQKGGWRDWLLIQSPGVCFRQHPSVCHVGYPWFTLWLTTGYSQTTRKKRQNSSTKIRKT